MSSIVVISGLSIMSESAFNRSHLLSAENIRDREEGPLIPPPSSTVAVKKQVKTTSQEDETINDLLKDL